MTAEHIYDLAKLLKLREQLVYIQQEAVKNDIPLESLKFEFRVRCDCHNELHTLLAKDLLH